MKQNLYTLKDLMEQEVFKQAKSIKYIDNEENEVVTKKPILIASVLRFDIIENDVLLVQLLIYNNMPDGWKEREGALTAPKGFCWITNSKSVFDENYCSALFRNIR